MAMSFSAEAQDPQGQAGGGVPQLRRSSQNGGNSKVFVNSVIYGTLAGTLIGVASLAFTSNPGANLNAVARGASYGLYSGIALGIYLKYGVPDDDEEPSGEKAFPGAPIDRPPGEDPSGLPPAPPPSPDGSLKSLPQYFVGLGFPSESLSPSVIVGFRF